MPDSAVMTRRSLRLSTRVTLFFGVVALLGGFGLTVATYVFARNSLLAERQASATTTSISHARNISDVINSSTSEQLDTQLVSSVLEDLDVEAQGGAIVLPPGFDPDRTEPRELSSRNGFSASDIPADLMRELLAGTSSLQRFHNRDGDPFLGIGIAINASGIGYFESFPLDGTEQTLRTLSSALLIGSFLGVLVAGGFGWSVSRRLLQPLSTVADAAEEIASGSLDARLVREEDPDLQRLASSFNAMANAVQERIEREQRFASDVSHELRSPITALSAAVEVLAKRRDEFSDRTQQALDVVVGQVRRFDDMVIDLLELSRLEAGAQELNQETTDIVDLSERVASRAGFRDLPIELHRRANSRALVDRIRFERIVGNLIENAATHAGGPIRISIEPSPDPHSVLLAVEDAGPGVAVSEESRIFERFARGSAARHRIGTGLGLALVAEHASAMGGDTWVEPRLGGGSRFVVKFPTSPAGVDLQSPSRRERTP